MRTRIRVGSAWADSWVLNISSRGLRLSCTSPPPRGSYLEVRRGAYIIVGRVMWSDGECCGIRTQNPIAVDDFMSAEHPTMRMGTPEASPAPAIDTPRRRASAHRHEQSRHRSRAIQYVGFALVGAAAALLARGVLIEAFSMPLATVEAAFARR